MAVVGSCCAGDGGCQPWGGALGSLSRGDSASVPVPSPLPGGPSSPAGACVISFALRNAGFLCGDITWGALGTQPAPAPPARGGNGGGGTIPVPPSQLPPLAQAARCHPTSHPRAHGILLPRRQRPACARDVPGPAGAKSCRDEPSLVGKGRDALDGQGWGKRGWKTGMGCARRQDSRHDTPRQRLGSGWSSAPCRHRDPGSTLRHLFVLPALDTYPASAVGRQKPAPRARWGQSWSDGWELGKADLGWIRGTRDKAGSAAGWRDRCEPWRGEHPSLLPVIS